MRRATFRGALFLVAGALFGQVIPGRYIVQFDDSAKSGRAAGIDRQALRAATVDRGGAIRDTYSRIFDGSAVEIDEAGAAWLAAQPGVRKVYPDREVHLHMDRAADLVGAVRAWQRLGSRDRAGAGVKIAIIDTGIDVTHPAFQSTSLEMPEGFPKGNRESDLAGTNNKIIVSRSYENLIRGAGTPTTRDLVGHGTAVAMIAAGVRHNSPLGEISGIAPGAFLGAYKVFGGSGEGTTSLSVVMRAMEDAVEDGMNVINLSLGLSPALAADEDPLAPAARAAFERGVLVVNSAGNDGPDVGTMNSLAAASPEVIAVGGIPNDRILASAVVFGDTVYRAIPGDVTPTESISAVVVAANGDGLACEQQPAGSMSGRIALILRGTCTFEEKLNNVQNGGAIAAIIYTDDRPVNNWTGGQAQLPGLMISNGSGVAIRDAIRDNPDLGASLRFGNDPVPVDPKQVWDGASIGPTADARIKPDLVAVAAAVYTAAQTTDSLGSIYSPSGYRSLNGTSFSSPMVAGAAAVVRAARPGLSAIDYRSLLINSAAPLETESGIAGVQHAGAGVLNLDAALSVPATAAPASISFGAAIGSANRVQELFITNVSGRGDRFTVIAEPLSGPSPFLSQSELDIDAGGTARIDVRWNVQGLEPGEHQGFLRIRASQGEADLRVPYWYGVLGETARSITIFPPSATPRAGAFYTLQVKINDAAGMALGVEPQVEVLDGTGALDRVRFLDATYPGVWEVRLRLGAEGGIQSFRIFSGETSRVVRFQVN